MRLVFFIVLIFFLFFFSFFQPKWSYTVITGSTDGIGREYAKQLANRGINIVLISRTKSKLIEVANEIGKTSS